jgi:phage portal protein BeeE
MKPLIQTTTQLNDAYNANGVAFQNMAPAGVLNGEPKSEDTALSQEQVQGLQDGFLARHKGQSEWKKILVSWARLHWTQIGFSPVDMQILEFMDKAEQQIAKVYHYPLGLLKDEGIVANSEINSRRLITDAVMPYIRRFDDSDTNAVRSWYGYQSLQVMTDLQYYSELSDDMEKVSKWLKDCYWLSLEEKRRVMDYEEEMKEGTFLVPSSLVPLSDILLGDLDGGESLEL